MDNYKLNREDICETPLTLISAVVAEYFGIDEEYIFHRCRDFDVIRIRYTFMALAKELNSDKVSYAFIGSFCERKYGLKGYDHATVINAIKKHRDMIDTLPEYREHYYCIKSEVEAVSNLLNEKRDEILLLKKQLISKISQALGVEEIKSLLSWYLASLSSADSVLSASE